MKRIKILCCLITLILIYNNSQIHALQKKEYMHAPNPYIYNDYSELWEKDSYDATYNKWYVFSDKASVKLYKTEQMKQTIYQSLFLEKFVIIKKQNHHILIETVNKPIVKGWARIEDFIILPHALKTKHSITHKAVLINRLEKIKGDVNTVYPLKSPLIDGSRINDVGIKILKFAHIYKYFPSQIKKNKVRFVLLGKNSLFFPNEKKGNQGSIDQVILGWVPADRILEWNTREALQPNEKRQYPIYYFKNKSDLISYYRSNYKEREPDKKLLVIKPDAADHIDRSKWPADVMRYTIHDKIDRDKPVKIGISTASLQSTRIGQLIERQSEQAEMKNIVFLIDATQSMKKYIKLTHKILKAIKKKMGTQNTKYGFAVYRDYKDNQFKFEKIQDLSNQIPDAMKEDFTLPNDEIRNDPSAFPEAVFQGIIRCIDGMSWDNNSTRLLIHIADAGNDSRGEDAYIEKDIAKKLVEKNISYSVIQILGRTTEEDKIYAEKLLCKQVYNIFKFTAKLWIKKFENALFDRVKKKSDAYQNYIRNLKIIVYETNDNSCCDDSVCCSCGGGRLLLTCLPSDYNNAYSQRIEEEIQRLSEQLSETQKMLSELRFGNLPDINTDTTVSSYRPQLMQSIIDNLIESIGASQIFNLQLSFNSIEDRQKAIQEYGKKIFNQYLDQEASFFTNAYVLQKIPDTNSPDQFKKMVLLQKNELEDLIAPLDIFVHQYNKQIYRDNIKQIWVSMMKSIIGQGTMQPLSNEFYSFSMKELYKQQNGISMRNNHRLLHIPYKDIESGRLPDNILSNIDQLEKDLSNSYAQMKRIYDNPSNFFTVFNKQYIWIEASKLL